MNTASTADPASTPDPSAPVYPPLPAWVKEIRPHQAMAVQQAVEAFDEGADVVFIDAPTGSGKTLIGEMIRRRMGCTSAVYVCSDKTLQDQFARDFPYAKVLKGRANYRTEYGGDAVTCEDCTSEGPQDPCMWCAGQGSCPYRVAKREAKQAQLAVVNTSYLLSEANYVGDFSGYDLVIIDEADTLESMLMGFVEYTVPRYVLRDLHMKVPVKAARKATLVAWLEDLADAAKVHLQRNAGTMEVKQRNRWRGFATTTVMVAGELQKDIDQAGTDDEDAGKWLRDYDTDTFCMKPVLVSGYGPKNLWRHGKKFLLMSATVVSADEMADSLGLPLDWSVITVPMTFPVENRPIVIAPIADVTYKNQDIAVWDLAWAIKQICQHHKDDRILVHTVSYTLNKKLADALKQGGGVGRVMVTYSSAKEREQALRTFLATESGILLAPSMERGVDLKDDAARVVIVAKVPFPALGDRRIKARTMLPGGQQWYTVQTVRDIVQMTGRGVRNEQDWCTTYILDRQFTKNVWKNKMLFPSWWREAVDSTTDVRWLIPPHAKSIATR